MLAALLLLGLLPLATMPLLQTQAGFRAGGDDGDDDGGRDAEAPEDAGVETVPVDSYLQDALPGEGPGETHLLDATPGETVFDGFVPGADLVRLDLSGLTEELVFEESSGGGGAAVAFSVGQGSVVALRFEGLDAVPGDDIALTLSDDGGDTFEISFAEIAATAETATGDALDPMDPDQPDAAQGGAAAGAGLEPADPGEAAASERAEAAPALQPTDPDAPDAPAPGGDAGPGLNPVDPDQTDPAGTGADAGLDPVPPDDEVPGPEGDLPLGDLIARDSANIHGLGAALTAAHQGGTEELALGGGDDAHALPDDGVPGTGGGAVTLSEGTPVLAQDGPVAVLDGGAGDDTLAAGDGAAFVFGGAGDDDLTAGEGAAALYGGDGADRLDGSAGPGGYLDGGAGDDTLTGGAGADTLEGGEHGAEGAGDDLIAGGGGDDLIRGGHGADTLSGGDGDDVIDHLGRAGEREIAEHHEFAWHLDGDADSLEGGAGDDTLIMDSADVAEGGAGQDLFWVYSGGTGAAEILDFTVGEDFLRISLDPQQVPTGVAEVQVAPSVDGADAVVSVNGEVVAILRGAPGASALDVYAVAEADVFPAGP